MIAISIIPPVVCPICGAEEEHPDGKAIQLRVNKVHDGDWLSQCLVCSGGYDKPKGVFTQANHVSTKGWFIT